MCLIYKIPSYQLLALTRTPGAGRGCKALRRFTGLAASDNWDAQGSRRSFMNRRPRGNQRPTGTFTFLRREGDQLAFGRKKRQASATDPDAVGKVFDIRRRQLQAISAIETGRSCVRNENVRGPRESRHRELSRVNRRRHASGGRGARRDCESRAGRCALARPRLHGMCGVSVRTIDQNATASEE